MAKLSPSLCKQSITYRQAMSPKIGSVAVGRIDSSMKRSTTNRHSLADLDINRNVTTERERSRMASRPSTSKFYGSSADLRASV
jgi:hypothetical protein